MLIRPYDPADLAEWGRMRTALWPDQTPKDMSDWRRRPDTVTFVAERAGGGLCGFVDAGERSIVDSCVTSPVAFIEGWYVDADVRGQGVGADLVRAVERWARAKGHTELGSDTELENVDAQRAHEHLGFIETGRVVQFMKPL